MYAYHSCYIPYQYTPQNLRERLKEEWYSAKHWRSITDVSLTLKDIGSPDAREQYEQNFAAFIGILNRYVFKNAAKRYGKRLRVLGVIEKSDYGRWNIHCAIEPPAHLDAEQFALLVKKAWLRTLFGHEQMVIRPNADLKWIDYMLKLRQKSGLETCSDCILCTHYNPIADTKSLRGEQGIH